MLWTEIGMLVLGIALPYIGVRVLQHSFRPITDIRRSNAANGSSATGSGGALCPVPPPKAEGGLYPSLLVSFPLSYHLTLRLAGIACVSAFALIAAAVAMRIIYGPDNEQIHIWLVFFVFSVFTYYSIVWYRREPSYILAAVIPHARRRRLIHLAALLCFWVPAVASLPWRMPTLPPHQLALFTLGTTPSFGVIYGLCLAWWTAYCEPEEEIDLYQEEIVTGDAEEAGNAEAVEPLMTELVEVV
ncbi:hypothetical protein DFH06DRAFT_1487045 [Mycena polygramma]|nr:hypothetical protein DFH06DRAFT_1487045 [Mycena polygramma]